MHSSPSGRNAICIRSADALANKCFGAPDRMVIRNLASVGIVAGLGQSIVKKLVEAMGGALTCESAAGGGTRFTVRLPKARQP